MARTVVPRVEQGNTMKTKYLMRFLNRAAHFDADLELVDVLSLAVKAGRLVPVNGTSIFEFVDGTKHPRLAGRQPSDGSRAIALTHLKNTTYGGYLKDLYEDACKYFMELVKGAARKGVNPDRLLGEHKVSFDANDVLKARSWDGVLQLVAESLFRKLEQERDTLKMVQALGKKLDLGLDQQIIQAALPFMMLRHILVHRDGVADQEFCSCCPSLGAEPDQPIPLSIRIVSAAREKIVALVRHIDERAVQKEIVCSEDLQP